MAELELADACAVLARTADDPFAGHEAAVLLTRELERITEARVRAGQ
ncbi:hypothetical protein H8K00_15060, partial [Clostridium perfringens]|nr:hypothetical protein [Clostridium perfringens]